MQQPNKHIFEFDAIGSRFWLEDLTGAALPFAITDKILASVAAFNDDYSRFRPQSLVMQLADEGVLHSPPLELLQMLTLSKDMYAVSDGAFNITIGSTLNALGYGNAKRSGKALADPWEHINWNTEEVRVPAGTVLDFGGLGKGWLIDKIADILRTHGIGRFIVNGGGDLYVQNTEPIEFALEDPLHTDKVLRVVHIQQGALAGSDTLKRVWDSGAGRQHHIIDPTTQRPSDSGVIASYVLADTALMADVAATILIIKPNLKDSFEQQYGLKSLLIKAP